MNLCDIVPKWIIQRGNQPTKMKAAQQKNKKLLMWQVLFKSKVDGVMEGIADCVVGKGTAVSGEDTARQPEELREAQLIHINEDTVVMERMKLAQGKGCPAKTSH